MSRIYEPEGIKGLIKVSNKAVERAMVALYERQTQLEQNGEMTVESNGVGFSAFHAKLGTYYARWVLDGKRLSGAHLERARTIALRYVGQLTDIANERIDSPLER